MEIMNLLVSLVVLSYVLLAFSWLSKPMAKGMFIASSVAVGAIALHTATPEQWYRICHVTIWFSYCIGALALIGGALAANDDK